MVSGGYLSFTFIAEMIDKKVEIVSAKMCPCAATILEQLMNIRNKKEIPIYCITDVFLIKKKN